MNDNNVSMITPGPAPTKVEAFMNAAIVLGCRFLECGGPVTRLESQLSAAGDALGIQTTVNAMPSTISVYCFDRAEGKSYSRSQRITSFNIDLGQLKFTNKILSQFALGKISPNLALTRTNRLRRAQNKEDLPTYGLSIFGIGAGAVLITGATLQQAVLAAFFTFIVQLLVVALRKLLNFHFVMKDFIGCFLAIFLSAPLAHVLEVPPQLLSLGTLVYFVPGLLMTTAISEIVDQNYLSGTIRLLKAFYTFMSMALAYFLAQDLAKGLNLSLSSQEFVDATEYPLISQLIGSALIVLSSSLEFRAHRRSIIRILICGMSGAVTYFLVSQYSYLVLSSFCGAFVIGAISFWLGRRYKHPSQIYSMPSVLILVPGMLAFSSFGYTTKSLSTSVGTDFMMGAVVHAMIISLAIVFGLAAGRIPFSETSLKNSNFTL